jgi:hypothetical protein
VPRIGQDEDSHQLVLVRIPFWEASDLMELLDGLAKLSVAGGIIQCDGMELDKACVALSLILGDIFDDKQTFVPF